MRITHLLFNLRTGGTENLLLDIVNGQAAIGHDVTLILINDKHEQRLINQISNKVNVVYLNRREGSKNPIWLLRVNYAILKSKPQIVHVHNLMALGLIHCKRYKLVFTHHTTGIPNRWAYKVDQQVCITKAVQDDITSRGFADSKVVYNGIDLKRIAHKDNYDITQSIRIVQVGRLNSTVKGQDCTLRAIAKIGNKNISIDFIGDGESRQELETLATQLGISSQVRFKGSLERKDIYSQLKDYDIAILSSRIEGFGLTLAEAMAAKVPVLTSDLPGPLEVVDGGHLAEVFKVDDDSNLAEKINSIISNYDKHVLLAQNDAYNFVMDTFDISMTINRYLKIYSDLL
jgi:glycosyltransferase involved in cell wall biosynthesis